MQKLCALLGMPQQRFASVHVVGTNGKSSVTRMTAALLEAHGVGTGACLSPHASRWSERVLLHGEEIAPGAFAAAVGRAAEAADVVNRASGEAERSDRRNPTVRVRSSAEAAGPVTQFELATAAAFVALAAAGVGAAVIEAGLGGRLDATNTIPSRVTVLTSIGRDHTEWLGESEAAIAAEKLAVLRDSSTLVLGRVSPGVASLAERTARERGAKLVVAAQDPGPHVRLRTAGRFQRRNFALACAAAETLLGGLAADRVAEVAAGLSIPGRLERIADDPPVYLDAAHNPDGAAALAESLAEITASDSSGRTSSRMAEGSATAGRPVVGCLAILRDKDAAAMIRALAPALDRVVCSELPAGSLEARGLPGAASHRAADLARDCEAAGLATEEEPDFAAAVRRGRALASRAGGILLVSGSHYVLAPARAALAL
jgi:dihydrofolate synthase/folylpolyglutamate synthase